MITIKTLASSSRGNCIYISDSITPLLLDCGISLGDIRKKLDFGVSSIAGVLVSHSHKDHSKAVYDITKAGIDCYLGRETADALEISGHRVRIIEPKKQFSIGTWEIKPFLVAHDIETFGFLLMNQVGEKLLFAVDLAYCRYTFSGLNYILIECNFDPELLRKNQSIPFEVRKRIYRSHFSIENVKEFLRANDLSQVHEIHLLHLSDGNSDEARFKREIQKLTGKMVMIAQA